MFGKDKTEIMPRVSRGRFQVIDWESAPGEGVAPTDEERAWYQIMKSDAPEMEKIKRKISVCAIADVVSYSNDEITIAYDGTEYTIKKPANSLRIARAREYSIMSALEELNNQRCITTKGVTIPKDFSGIDAEVIKLLSAVCEPFFFMPYF